MAERFKGMRNVKDTNLNRVTHQTWYNKLAIKDLINSESIEANEVTSVPATASSPGNPGQYAFGGGFFYICVATNSWERVATAAW